MNRKAREDRKEKLSNLALLVLRRTVRRMEHFVGFDFQIAQRFGGLLKFGIGLKQVPHL